MTTFAILIVSMGSALADLTVYYYNAAGIPAKPLRAAVEVANRPLRQAKINVRWVDCYTHRNTCRGGPALELSIVQEPRAVQSMHFSMGYSLLPRSGRGVYAKVMWNRVRQYASAIDLPAVTVLGHAIAHEIGHLLLNTAEHSPSGRWTKRDCEWIRNGRMAFHRAQAARMRRSAMELASRPCAE